VPLLVNWRSDRMSAQNPRRGQREGASFVQTVLLAAQGKIKRGGLFIFSARAHICRAVLIISSASAFCCSALRSDLLYLNMSLTLGPFGSFDESLEEIAIFGLLASKRIKLHKRPTAMRGTAEGCVFDSFRLLHRKTTGKSLVYVPNRLRKESIGLRRATTRAKATV
jgi:hypothetical protein